MAIQLVSARQAAALHGVKAMVYAKAGFGKTVLCSTAPTPVVISAEAGLLSLRHLDIPVIQIHTINDLMDAYAWAQSSKESSQFESICIDSISEVGEVVLSNAKKQVRDPRQAYGELIEKMTDTIRAFRDLPGKHVVMTAKQELIKDEGSGVTMYGPSMPGRALGQQLPYFFDEVFNIGIGKTDDGTEYRFLRTQPDFQYDAKDRSGALDPVEPPNLTHVFQKIVGGSK